MSDAELDHLLENAMAEVAKAMHAAFNAGKESGLQEARTELAEKLSSMIGSIASHKPERSLISSAGERPPTDRPSQKRAPQGSIKPALLRALEPYPLGLPASDIVASTGFKENTVRGTLRQLLAEGKVLKRNNFWLIAKKDEGSPAFAGEPSQ